MQESSFHSRIALWDMRFLRFLIVQSSMLCCRFECERSCGLADVVGYHCERVRMHCLAAIASVFHTLAHVLSVSIFRRVLGSFYTLRVWSELVFILIFLW